MRARAHSLIAPDKRVFFVRRRGHLQRAAGTPRVRADDRRELCGSYRRTTRDEGERTPSLRPTGGLKQSAGDDWLRSYLPGQVYRAPRLAYRTISGVRRLSGAEPETVVPLTELYRGTSLCRLRSVRLIEHRFLERLAQPIASTLVFALFLFVLPLYKVQIGKERRNTAANFCRVGISDEYFNREICESGRN